MSVTEDGLTAETGLTIKRFKLNGHMIYPTSHLYELPPHRRKENNFIKLNIPHYRMTNQNLRLSATPNLSSLSLQERVTYKQKFRTAFPEILVLFCTYENGLAVRNMFIFK